MTQLSTNVAVAAVITFFIQQLKQSRFFPWITAETVKINRVVAIILSGLATLGVHFVCSKTDHSCTVTWVDWTTVAVGLWHWLVQFVVTHGWYKATTSKA